MNTPLLTLILAGLAMIGPFSIDTFLPSFPSIAEQFAVGLPAVQQTLSLYLGASSVMSLFYGTLSDSFGRRPVILAALVVFAVASVGAALTPTFGGLLAFRTLQGLSSGAGMVVGQAIIRDRFTGPAAQRLMSHITMVFGLAPAIAPVLGGYLHVAFGWRSAFVFMAVWALVLLLASHRFLGESLPKAGRARFHPVSLAERYWRALRHPLFVFRCLAVGFAFSGLGLHVASAANLILNLLHLPETAFAWLFVPMIGGLVAGSAIGARLAHRRPVRVVRGAGFACMAAAGLADVAYNLAFTAQVPWAVLPVMLYTLGMGLAVPTMNLATVDLFPEMRGLASSLLGFTQMLIFSLVSGVVAPLLFGSALHLAIGLLACCGLAVLAWAAGNRPLRQA